MRASNFLLIPTFCLVAAGVSAASVEGTLIDGTAGGSGRAERVALIRLVGGMQQVAEKSDVTGSFRFDNVGDGPFLLQAVREGVTYTARVAPEVAMTPITVFDSSDDASILQIAIPHLLVIVDGPKLHVSKIFEVTNPSQPPRSVVGQPGAFRFSFPQDATALQAAVTTTSMPLKMEPVDAQDDRGQTIAYPMKPGVTRYTIQYELPYPGAVELEEQLFHGATAVSVIVVPAEVEATVEGLTAMGRRDHEGVSIRVFQGEALAVDQILRIRIKGEAVAPPVPGSAASTGPAAGGAGTTSAIQGEIKEVPSPSGRGSGRWILLIVTSGALLMGLVFAYRAGGAVFETESGVRVSFQTRTLLDAIAALDDDHRAGKVSGEEHRSRRAKLTEQLAGELAEGRGRKSA